MIVLAKLGCAAALAIGLASTGCSAPYSNDPSFAGAAPEKPVNPSTGGRGAAPLPQGTGGS